MPADLQNISAKALDVQIIPPPTPINATVLRQLFVDLARYNLEVYNPTPDGGAVFSNPAQQRRVIITPVNRQVTMPVEIDAPRSLSDVVDILSLIHHRIQVPTYVASAFALFAHLPVTGGESAADLLRRKAFANQECFAALGPGIQGIGLRVYMTATGPFTFSIEPLLADLSKVVIHLQQTMPGNFELPQLRGRCETTLRFYDNQLRNFLQQMLSDN